MWKFLSPRLVICRTLKLQCEVLITGMFSHHEPNRFCEVPGLGDPIAPLIASRVLICRTLALQCDVPYHWSVLLRACEVPGLGNPLSPLAPTRFMVCRTLTLQCEVLLDCSCSNRSCEVPRDEEKLFLCLQTLRGS